MRCDVCHAEIPEIRLRAIPDTRMCLGCAEHRVKRLRPQDVLEAMATSDEKDADEILRDSY
jgi:RNA polymerase-binding transcription factor DksA